MALASMESGANTTRWARWAPPFPRAFPLTGLHHLPVGAVGAPDTPALLLPGRRPARLPCSAPRTCPPRTAGPGESGDRWIAGAGLIGVAEPEGVSDFVRD